MFVCNLIALPIHIMSLDPEQLLLRFLYYARAVKYLFDFLN